MTDKPRIKLPAPITTPIRKLKLHPDDYSDDRPIFTADRPSRAEQQESGALCREAHDRYGSK